MAERSPRHIFLAPHYDDVALSCGGTVAAMAETGERPLVVTVFGGTPSGPLTRFASDMHERWGVGPGDAVAMRRREDRCAEEALGAESIWFDFLDAIYRNARYTSDADLFGRIHPDEQGLNATIVDALSDRLQTTASDAAVVYVPLAVGNHVDHQHALAVGKRLAALGHDVWAYEDFPYAGDPEWRGTIQERVATVTAHESRLQPLTPAQLERKVSAVLCYASQLDIIFRHQGDPRTSVERYARVAGNGEAAERYWRLTP